MVETGDALASFLECQPSLAPLEEGLRRAAASEASLLVLGEPGTGRSRLARALHASSGRSRGDLVEIDAASLPADLFEAELFGFTRGAFTGAERASEGRVGRAAGGTLLLDHVEAIPVGAQAKLLRLIAEKRYAPLGDAERAVDLRIAAIGPADLEERVAGGLFRDDLFYRLDVLTVRLPPLRQRPGDVAPLARAMLADLALRYGRDRLEVAAADLELLAGEPWPGNLRQLENRLERAVVLRDGGGPLRVEAGGGSGSPRDRPESLHEVERRAILAALAHTRGHQGRAAEILGISRKALWQKRKRYGLP